MEQTLTVVFDGKVLRPESPLNLQPNTRYLITIQNLSSESTGNNAWDTLEALVGTVDAPSDWAKEHDHYLYGTAKIENENE